MLIIKVYITITAFFLLLYKYAHVVQIEVHTLSTLKVQLVVLT